MHRASSTPSAVPVGGRAGRHRPAEQRTSTFAALRVRNYRLFFAGQVVSNTGTWMQRIAQDWLVLQITNSPLAVGITTALQFLPMLLFGLWGGLLVDRYPKRRLLLITQSVMGALAALLAILTITGAVQVWQVYLIALGLGFATVVDNPARQTFVNEMVPKNLVRNAVGLNSGNFQLARMLGPAVAGVLISLVGIGAAFALNALSFVAVITALLLMRTKELQRMPLAPRGPGQLREGLRYVRRTPALLWPIVLVFFVGTFGYNFAIILSAYTKDVFDSGAEIYGLLNTAMAAGSVVGALVAARRTNATLAVLFAAAAGVGLGLDPARPDAVVHPLRRAVDRRRLHLGHVQHARQFVRAAGQLARAPRPGDEPVHAGVHGRHAAGLAGGRLDHRAVGRADRADDLRRGVPRCRAGGRGAGRQVGRDHRPPEPAPR